jgi:hypothetical protein
MKTWDMSIDDVYVGMNDLNFVWTLYCGCDELYMWLWWIMWLRMDNVIVNGLYVIMNGLYDFVYENWI